MPSRQTLGRKSQLQPLQAPATSRMRTRSSSQASQGSVMADHSLKTWISDNLMSIVGFTQTVIVQCIIRLAKGATSPSELISKLVASDFPPSADTHSFAHELFNRVPHVNSDLTDYQKMEIEATKYAKKQASYKLLDADNEDNVHEHATIKDNSKSSTKNRFRKKGDARSSEDNEEITVIRGNGWNVRSRNFNVEDEDVESEEAMKRDQEEREQLEKNMKERDAARTRQLMEAKLAKKDKEEMAKRSKALEDDDTSHLRKCSRQTYLQKRADQKLLEIQDDIIDNEYIFEGVKLTEAEERELRLKKEIYELANKHREKIEDDAYIMPETYDQDGDVNQVKRFSAAAQRCNDSAAGGKIAEQEAWEEYQIGKATMKFGSKNKKKEADNFQYVFDGGIDFIKASVMEGIQNEDEKCEDFSGQSELKKIQDDKKTLPIHRYQKKLLKAIYKYQVIVIVRETGSGKTTQIPQYLHNASYTKHEKVTSSD